MARMNLRNDDGEELVVKKRKVMKGDILDYLKTKSENELKIREKELELQKQMLDKDKDEKSAMFELMSAMLVRLQSEADDSSVQSE